MRDGRATDGGQPTASTGASAGSPDAESTDDAGNAGRAAVAAAWQDLVVVATRELRTVARTPALVAISVGFAASVFGVAWAGTGAGGGFVPLTLDLLTFVEVLVPLLSVAFGYRSILGDRRTGELDVLRTFDVHRVAYVGGVYLGRALALVTLVVASLLGVGLLVPFFTADLPTFLAINEAVDSEVRYVRFVVLSAVFTLVVLAATVAISAATRTLRAALALAVALVLALVLGFDTALVAGLAGGAISDGGLAVLVAGSPNSAYRGLVLSAAVGVVGGTDVAAGTPVVNLVGLATWWLLSISVAVWRVWPVVERSE